MVVPPKHPKMIILGNPDMILSDLHGPTSSQLRLGFFSLLHPLIGFSGLVQVQVGTIDYCKCWCS